MRNAQGLRLLDFSRLLSRAGRQLTGIDRVERAYLDRLFQLGDPFFGLARTRLGYLLVDRAGLMALEARLCGRVAWADSGDVKRSDVEAEVRRHAKARCLPTGLGAMLRRHLPSGTLYLNVGHSSLTDRVFAAMKSLPDARIAVVVHDMIPLDFPEYQKAGTPKKFEKKMRRVAAGADLVICVSDAVRKDVARYFSEWGRVPDITVAHLGAATQSPVSADLDTIPASDAPYFVALGTIEPRKNHGFLLDLWDALPEAIAPSVLPRLFIVGSRGWNNKSVFTRLDRLKPTDPIVEINDLSDAGVSALLSKAAGLLAPSLAEGFGLPLLEAVQLGTPILANDLPVFREFLGEIPVYAEVNDQYQWLTNLRRLADADRARSGWRNEERKNVVLPTWDRHFNQVLSLT